MFFFGIQLLAAAFVFWEAHHARYCCDTDYYLHAADAIWRDGLLWQDSWLGYRYYLTPLMLGSVLRVVSLFTGNPADAAKYISFGLACAYCCAAFAASWLVWRREGPARWRQFAVPILCNPFALALVPLPMQESVIAIVCLPLMVALVALKHLQGRWLAAVAAVLAGTLIGARASLVWMTVPIVLFVVWRAASVRTKPAEHLRNAALALALLAAILAPQAYVALRSPAWTGESAAKTVYRVQQASGIEQFNYTTAYDANGFRAAPTWSPYRTIPADQKELSFYHRQPAAGLFLVLAHVWSGLHYVWPTPYTPASAMRVFSPWLLLSALTVACGLLGLGVFFQCREDRPVALFFTVTLLGSCAYTAFTAVEGRFGLFGFLALSVFAWRYVTTSGRATLLRTAPLVIAYVLLSCTVNGLLLYRSPQFGEQAPANAPPVGARRDLPDAITPPSEQNIDRIP